MGVETVTNHNWRVERQRAAKRVKTIARRNSALGLVEPGPQALAAERAAHQSITPTDAPTVAWIIKQPALEADFFSLTRLLYAEASTML